MAQSLGLYQLQNLRRAQTKFIFAAVTEDAAAMPSHDLLKPDFVLAATEASSKIQACMAEQGYPVWWPIVLISRSGHGEAEVVKGLEAQGLTNVFSYRGGWECLLSGT